MPTPDVGDLHTDTLLSQVSVGWKPGGFFALNVFPVVPVQKQTDIWVKYDKSYFARDMGDGTAPAGSYQGIRRAPGTAARNVSFDVTNQTAYYCINYALGAEIPDELRANADSVFSLDSDYLGIIQTLMALRFDREFVADFLATSKWTGYNGGDVTGGSTFTKWSTYESSTPISDMRAILDYLSINTLGMSDQGGIKIIMGPDVERKLLDHPDIIDRITYAGTPAAPTQVTRALLATLFGVDQIIVPKSVYTESEMGTAEASVSYSRVMTDDMWVGYCPSQTRLTPSAGYLFNWASMASGGLQFVRRGRVERERYDWVEVHAYLDWVQQEAASGTYCDDMVD